MRMKSIGVIVGGIIVTLLTGWIPGFLLLTNSTIRILSGYYLGASNYGLPIVWRSVIVYPGSPTNYNMIGLIGDVVIWILVFWLVLAVLRKRK